MAYIPGMPSGDYKDYKKQKEREEEKKKQQEKKKKDESSSSSKSTVPGLPSDVAERKDVQQRAQEQYNNLPSQKLKQQQAENHQQITNFINSIPTTGFLPNNSQINTSKVLSASDAITTYNQARASLKTYVGNNTVKNGVWSFHQAQQAVSEQEMDRLPSSEKERIKKNIIKGNASLNSTNGKESLNLKILQRCRAEQQAASEMPAFEDMLSDAHFQAERTIIPVRYATSIDYNNMMNTTYRTVYVEDGTGSLEDKHGIYTIGRENLSGLPSGVSTVMVDKNNNWFYIANDAKRPEFVKEMQAEQAIKEGKYKARFVELDKSLGYLRNDLDIANSVVDRLEDEAFKVRTQEAWTAYQEALEARNKLATTYNDTLKTYGYTAEGYANMYTRYADIIDGKQGWTLDDEQTYQKLLHYLNFESQQDNRREYTGMPSDVKGIIAPRANEDLQTYLASLAAFQDLKAKREKYKDMPVFMSKEALEKLNKDSENMKKYVDQYNLWNSCTIDFAKGEDFEAGIIGIILNAFTRKGTEYGQMSSMLTGDSTMLAEYQQAEKLADKGTAKSIGSIKTSYEKSHRLPGVVSAEVAKAVTAYNNDEITRAELTDEIMYDASQFKNIALNNLAANMGVFNLASIEQEFVAWKMARNPELYAQDAKFKKLQEAYKVIYGTNYRGKVDAMRMAWASLLTKTNQYDDYIKLDSSDLRHSNGQQYGFIESFIVGNLTDVGNILGLASKAGEAVIKGVTASAMNDTITDALTTALKNSGVEDDVAEAFVKSKNMQDTIWSTSYRAMSGTFEEGGEEIVNAIVKAQEKRFSAALLESSDDVLRKLEHSKDVAFTLESMRALDKAAPDLVSKTLILSKASTVTSALKSTSEMIDSVQKNLFLISCPVAGTVKGLVRGKTLVTNIVKAISDPKLKDLITKNFAHTENQVMAALKNLDVDTVLMRGRLDEVMEEVNNGFRFTMLETRKASKSDIVTRVFRDTRDVAVKVTADETVSKVFREFSDTLDTKGLQGLTEYAAQKGFKSFDELLETAKTNAMEVFGKYSTDVPVFIEAFEAPYKHAVVEGKLEQLQTHMHATKTFSSDLKEMFLGKNAPTAVMVERSPSIVQAATMAAQESIENFMATVNPAWASISDTGSSLYEAAQNALDKLSTTSAQPTVKNFIATRRAVLDYCNVLNNVYHPMADEWYSAMYYANTGVLDYASKLADFSVDPHFYAHGSLETYTANLTNAIKELGYNGDVSQILDGVLLTEKEISTLDLNKLSVVQRIMLDKGSNTIAQVHDKDFMNIANMLCDSSESLNKQLYLYRDSLVSTISSSVDEKLINKLQRQVDMIDSAIVSASAAKSTQVLVKTLDTLGLPDDIYHGILDSWVGNKYINSIIQSYPNDEAATKIVDMLCTNTQKQLALHRGKFMDLHTCEVEIADGVKKTFNANTVDVGHNSKEISSILDAKGYPTDPQYRDICFSTTRVTSGGTPKDIGFFIRGSEEEATVFRKQLAFDVRDDAFAGRVYGTNAEGARKAYAAIDQTDALTREEWMRSVNEFINEQKELALKENKKIRFIGFNSSDAISGDNKFLNDILQESGVSIDTSSAIDFADIIRKESGEFIIGTDEVAKLRMGVADAIRESRKNSILLNTSPVLTYDSSTTFADMLREASTMERDVINSKKVFSAYGEMWDYIDDSMKTLSNNLGKANYEVAGEAMGTYINMQRLSENIHDFIGADIRMSDAVMQATQDILAGNMQLGLKKVFDKEYISQWFDTSFMSVPTREFREVTELPFIDGEYALHIYDNAKRLNTIYNTAKRLDLITDDDLQALIDIRTNLLEQFGKTSRASEYIPALNVARLIDVNKLNAQQMYAVNVWMIEKLTEMKKYTDPDFLKNLPYELINIDKRMGTALSEDGRKHILHNIVDYSDPLIDPKAVRYFDDSEEGFRMALELDDIKTTNRMFNNLDEYNRFHDLIYKRNGAHGTLDKIELVQSAAVNDPLVQLQKQLIEIYDTAEADALKHYIDDLQYDESMAKQFAAKDARKVYMDRVAEDGNTLRNDSVKAVAALDEKEFKAHLIRNCGGGMILEPGDACLEGINVPELLNKWRSYGITCEEFTFKHNGLDRSAVRCYISGLGKMDPDELFREYGNVNIKFVNKSTQKFNNGMRHCSFDASDMTLMDGTHMQAFKELFFDNSDDILDLNGRFNQWSNELYCCNMWTSPELKRAINPYYTDNYVRNLAQNTHQMRHNMTCLHDFGTLLDNPYMKSSNILTEAGVYDASKPFSENLRNITQQLAAQKNRLCVIVADGKKGRNFKVVDYTKELKKTGIPDEVSLQKLLDNTILLDEGMYNALTDWTHATSIAVQFMQSGSMSRKFAHAFKIYSSTLRSHFINWALYGNIGTGVRNLSDASLKAFNEVMQSNRSMRSFTDNYLNAVSDADWYVNVCKQIEADPKLGAVNRETIRQYFKDSPQDMHKFNVLYGFERTSGGNTLVDYTLAESRKKSADFLVDSGVCTADVADELRKTIDGVYSSIKYRGLNKAEIAERFSEIQADVMKKVTPNKFGGTVNYDLLKEKFFDYKPTVASWGDSAMQYNPVMQANKAVFDNAEVRARVSLYKTMIDAGESEAEAMAHVTATQFDYAGMKRVETFMPFTQYKIYNAVYWFDHADVNAIKTAWRYAQYNDDGSWTSEEIAEMCAKYQQRQYYLYDRKGDADYNAWANDNVSWVTHTLSDGIDSYLGLPRELQAGSIDTTGTHYLKLGNSFVEELSLISSLSVGAYMMGTVLSNKPNETEDDKWENIRAAYDALKCTPLYDSLYSPWKAYLDFAVYVHDREAMSDKTKWQHYGGVPSDVYEILNPKTFPKYIQEFMANKSTHSIAVQGIPLVGIVLSNVIGRVKSAKLNLGEMQALMASPAAQKTTWSQLADALCDMTGAISPSLMGTHKQKEKTGYNYYEEHYTQILLNNPTNYIDYLGRLEQMGFKEDTAKGILRAFKDLDLKGYDKQQRLQIAQDLLGRGYTLNEVSNLLRQASIDITDSKEFLAMWQALPDFLKYDATSRNQALSYYTAMGLNKREAWARLVTNPGIVRGDGTFIELSANDVALYNKIQNDTYNATQGYIERTPEQWQEYWDAYNATLRASGYFYPKGEQKRIREYLMDMGYTFEEAQKMILNGVALDKDGNLTNAQTRKRTTQFSYNKMSEEAWNAYWDTVPDYTKYEKGAFGRTMKALKAQGYDDNTARALIQQGIYVSKDGTMMNVAGMERPVLGYANFNTYYQTLPDFIKYEKGAFSRTYHVLKALGFDYDTSLMLIQQGAYIIDATGIPSMIAEFSRQNTMAMRQYKKNIKVHDVNTLLQKHGNTPIQGADGKVYLLINCSGLQRPRKKFSYSRRSYGGGGRRGGGGRSYSYGGGSSKKYSKAPRYSNWIMKKPFVTRGNVSTYNGFTNYRGSNKLTKPYTTKGYVSTYSLQNFLNGASYGMRKAYKIDMRQFKSGALSTKSAYPASYRNIAVAYRHNLYKDLYAKYGASRMMMRANKASYSNASIVRLRRNEIYNRERYAERRDQISKTKTQKKSTR